MFKLTDEQHAIEAACKDGSRDTIFVDACAGSGKSSTARYMAVHAFPSSMNVMFSAFNRNVNNDTWEWIKKQERRGLYSRTFNSMGKVILDHMLKGREVRLLAHKYEYIVADLINERFQHLSEEDREEAGSLLNRLVRYFMYNVTVASPDDLSVKLFGGNDANGDVILLPADPENSAVVDSLMTRYGLFGLENPVDVQRLKRCLPEVLKRGEQQLFTDAQFDFVDQVFWPVYKAADGIPALQRSDVLRPSDVVVVDEAQDLTALERALVSFFARRDSNGVTGRFYVVGDPQQAIYAWKGADAKGFENSKRFYNAEKIFTLSYSWRCTKKAAIRAQEWKAGFKVPATAAEGEESYITKQDLLDQTEAGWALVFRTRSRQAEMAMKLFMSGKKFEIVGSADFSAKLIKPIKIVMEHKNFTFEKLDEFLADHMNRTVERRRKAKKPEKEIAEFIDEIAATKMAIEIMMQTHPDIADAKTLIGKIEDLFGGNGSDSDERIKLYTGHTVKGMEFETVVNCTPDQFPLKWEGQTLAELEQEHNLKYVIETRTKNHYFMLDEKLALIQKAEQERRQAVLMATGEEPKPETDPEPDKAPEPVVVESPRILTLREKVRAQAAHRQTATSLVTAAEELNQEQLAALLVITSHLIDGTLTVDDLKSLTEREMQPA